MVQGGDDCEMMGTRMFGMDDGGEEKMALQRCVCEKEKDGLQDVAGALERWKVGGTWRCGGRKGKRGGEGEKRVRV